MLSASNGQKFKTQILHHERNLPFVNYITGEEEALILKKHMLPIELTVSHIFPMQHFSILRDMLFDDMKHASFEDFKKWKSGEEYKLIFTLEDLFNPYGNQEVSSITIS